MSPNYQSPMCGKAMGCGSTATPLGVHDANRHAVGIVCTAVHTSCSLPSWSANNTLLEQLSTRELVPDMAPIDTFMELDHDTCALFPAHASQDRMSVAMME